MNEAHFHLLVNHLPVIVPIIGLLVFLVGLFVKSEAIKRTALFLFVVGAIATIPAYFSGEGAEEIAETLPGVTEQVIDVHEDFAKVFAILSYVLGVVSLLGLWASWKQKGFASLLNYGIIAYAVVVTVFAARTALTGGEIRHTEIRADFAAAPLNVAADDKD